jgi:uncharacterized protein YcaQ
MIPVSRAAARRFLIDAFALNGFQTLPDVHAALGTLGFVQEDSINVCGRIHDLILWSRVRNYTPAALSAYLYGEVPRRAWEFYLPNLCVLPIQDYRYFAPAMRRNREKDSRWGRLTPEEEAAAQTLLTKIDADGPLFLRDAKAIGEAHGHTTSGWGTKTRLLSFVADKLFWQGHLGIAKRDGFLRAFDRVERLYPEEVWNAVPVTEEEANAYLLRKQLRARRLFRLRPAEKALLNDNETTPIQIENDKRLWHIFTDDLEKLATDHSSPTTDLHFLAPLDPLIYDRDRTRLLWDFEYTWEVYVPQEKRKWGYYVLPILWGDRLVGRIEPRIDKRSGTVNVVSLQWETGFDPAELGDALESRLVGFAALAC